MEHKQLTEIQHHSVTLPCLCGRGCHGRQTVIEYLFIALLLPAGSVLAVALYILFIVCLSAPLRDVPSFYFELVGAMLFGR